ncbi:MAG: hypothetical protein ABSG61_02130 [Gemmatimonadales bacterium]
MHTTPRSDERGMALVLVMLITVAVAALAAGAIFLTSSANLISKGQEREEDMRNAADAGIEIGRSALNGTPSLFPDTGYVTLFANQPVNDASGNPIPNVTRSIYVGPTGSSTGQYGIFGSVLSVISDKSGAVVVRRGELAQESFAKYAYYTNSEGSGICFGNMDQIFGPMHTNDDMCIYSSGARFHSTVEVAGSITGANYGTFDVGYIAHGAVVPLPTAPNLAKIANYATMGGMNFTAPTGGNATSSTESRLRIEFVALDLDGDGRVTGPNEGFFRVYMDTAKTQDGYATGSDPTNVYQEFNCGDVHVIGSDTTFFPAAYHSATAPYTATYAPYLTNAPIGGSTHSTSNRTTAGTQALYATSAHCYLGGDEHLNVDSAGTRRWNSFNPGTDAYGRKDPFGYWVKFTDTPDTSVIAALKRPASKAVDTTLAARQLEAKYLWPLARVFNVNSKGVIYVNGKVVLSGVVRGKVTVAASDNVIIADDLTYAISPGAVQCLTSDMLGVTTPGYVYMSDNVLNTPQAWGSGGAYKTYANTSDEFVQGVILTLNSFTVENYDTGPTSQEPCGTTATGRGCLYLTGGIIQGTRGAVGTTGGTGYVKRYAYDKCAFQTPPPYFPTTGRFYRNRYYEIDPVNFSVANFFNILTP